jgi:hypothetical protein
MGIHTAKTQSGDMEAYIVPENLRRQRRIFAGCARTVEHMGGCERWLRKIGEELAGAGTAWDARQRVWVHMRMRNRKKKEQKEKEKETETEKQKERK